MWRKRHQRLWRQGPAPRGSAPRRGLGIGEDGAAHADHGGALGDGLEGEDTKRTVAAAVVPFHAVCAQQIATLDELPLEPGSFYNGADLAGGFVSGLLHPVLGWDHVVAMFAVGLWGAFLGNPAIWLLLEASTGTVWQRTNVSTWSMNCSTNPSDGRAGRL